MTIRTKRQAVKATAKPRRKAVKAIAATPQVVAPPPIADLLAQSRAAHQRYRSSAGRISTTGKIAVAPHLLACGQAVQEALRTRTEAHALDPQQADAAAWEADRQALKGATSDSLIEFYAAYLSRAQVA